VPLRRASLTRAPSMRCSARLAIGVSGCLSSRKSPPTRLQEALRRFLRSGDIARQDTRLPENLLGRGSAVGPGNWVSVPMSIPPIPAPVRSAMHSPEIQAHWAFGEGVQTWRRRSWDASAFRSPSTADGQSVESASCRSAQVGFCRLFRLRDVFKRDLWSSRWVVLTVKAIGLLLAVRERTDLVPTNNPDRQFPQQGNFFVEKCHTSCRPLHFRDIPQRPPVTPALCSTREDRFRVDPIRRNDHTDFTAKLRPPA